MFALSSDERSDREQSSETDDDSDTSTLRYFSNDVSDDDSDTSTLRYFSNNDSDDDDIGEDDDEIDDYPFDWTKYEGFGLLLLNMDDLVYPNFPHIYNWKEGEFTNDLLRDSNLVASRYISDNLPIDPYVVLSNLYIASRFGPISSDRENSVLLARGFFDFLIIYTKSTSICESSTNYALYPEYKRASNLPLSLLNKEWDYLYERININDFLRFVSVKISSINFPKCEYYRVCESYVFFELSMRFLIFNFHKIDRDSLTMIKNEIYKNFIDNGDCVSALPYSFFLSKKYIRIDYPKIENNIMPLEIYYIVKNFIGGLRILNRDDISSDIITYKFQKIVPNYRYVNLKLLSFFDVYIRTGKIRYRHARRDTLITLKTFGLIPFDAVSTSFVDANDALLLSRITTKQLDVTKRWRADFKELYSLKNKNLKFFEKTLNVIEERYTRNDITPKNADTEVDDRDKKSIDECVICMNAKADVILLPCAHKICCMNCAVRLAECPFCRKYINCRLSNAFNIYDELQSCVLIESYSMFSKFLRYFVKNWFDIEKINAFVPKPCNNPDSKTE